MIKINPNVELLLKYNDKEEDNVYSEKLPPWITESN
jgi:hypothetical protein